MSCLLRDGFACFDGTEIWNVCRTFYYVDTLYPLTGFDITIQKDSDGTFCCGCCHSVYVDPATDEAPWYSPNHSQSEDFYGFFPTEIVGLTANPTTRTVGGTRNGARLSARNDPGRSIEVTLLAVGATCEAVEWGLAWLNHVLESTGGLAWENCCTAPESPSESPDGSEIFALGRNIPCVTMTEGIEAESFRPDALGGTVWEVTFTLTAEQSWIYDAPVTLLNEVVSGSSCVDYTPDCIDGAAIEIYVGRATNTQPGEVTVRSNPAAHLPDGFVLDNYNGRYGVVVGVQRGESVLVDPRCLGVQVVGPTGTPLGAAPDASMTNTALGLYATPSYGQKWRTCVSVPDNGGGNVTACIRAWPRRRI